MTRRLHGDAGPQVPFFVNNSFQSAHTSFYLFVYLLLFTYLLFIIYFALGLDPCTQAFSSWSERKLLSSCGDFSCCRVWGLDSVGATVVVHRLSCSVA